MPKRTSSRLSKRREAEAAEAGGTPVVAPTAAEKKAAKAKSPAAAKKRPVRRTKSAATERKRLVWGIFSGSLREEARYPYDQRAEADAKLELLRSKSKRLYFLQPIKEVIGDSPKPVSFEAPPEDDDGSEFDLEGGPDVDALGDADAEPLDTDVGDVEADGEEFAEESFPDEE